MTTCYIILVDDNKFSFSSDYDKFTDGVCFVYSFVRD